MSDYIERRWLLKHIHTGMDPIQMMQVIMDAPADAMEPALRCGECRHYGIGVLSQGPREYCVVNRRAVNQDDFCAEASRKE